MSKDDAKGRAKDSIKPYEDGENPFKVVRWFPAARNRLGVVGDNEFIDQVRDYYDNAIFDGQQYIIPKGNLETLLLQLSGITYFYQGIYVDCQQIRKWLEEQAEKEELEKYAYYMYNEEAKSKLGAAPKTTEAAKLAKGDDMVVRFVDMVRFFSYYENLLKNLIDAFDNNKYVLNNVVAIRKENLTEVWVDPSKETKNE